MKHKDGIWQRVQAQLRDYFGLSQAETRGFAALVLICLLCLLIPFAYRWLQTPTPDSSATDQRKLDSLLTQIRTAERQQPRFADRDENPNPNEHLSEPKLFRFDPNTVSVAGWQQLGLPRWLAERIDKYRRKGGRFRRKEDVMKIYDFPADVYAQLAPYMTLPDQTGNTYSANRPSWETQTSTTAASTPENRSADTYRPRAFERPALQPFDINTADTTQLKALKGIGSTLAARIVKFRDALGGFVSTEQFADIYGLDSLAKAELIRYAHIRTAARRIPINTASATDLDRLPFLSRRQAEIIVKYREQHGAYTSVEALRPIRVLDEKTISKIAPYLQF